MKRKALFIRHCLISCFFTFLPCTALVQSADVVRVRLVGWRDKPFHLTISLDGAPVNPQKGFIKVEDWPQKLTFSLRNTSERIVTRFTLWGQYRMSRSGSLDNGFMVEYGRGKMLALLYESSNKDKPIMPGETVEVRLTEKAMVKGMGPLVDELEIGVSNILLDDGTRWEVYRRMRRSWR